VQKTNNPTSVHAGARLDRLPIGRFHRRLFALVSAGLFFDVFDLSIGGVVMAALIGTGFSTLALNGWFMSCTFLGATLGAFCAGWFGDRFGRRFTYQMNLAIFGIGSIVAALSPNIYVLIGVRFIIGVGLGAEVVAGYGAFTEFVPPAIRGRWCGLLSLPAQISAGAVSVVGLLVIPWFGWRPMFVIVGVGAMVIWYLRKNMPESPRWLEQQGLHAEADAVLRSIEAEAHVAPYVPAPQEARQAAVVLPSNLRLLVPIFVGSVVLGVLNTAVFAFIGFIPTFFVQEGMSIVHSIAFTTIMTLGAPVGGVIALLIADKIGRKGVLVGSALIAATVSVLYPFVGNGLLLTLVGFVLVTAIYVNSVTGFALFVPETFPTEVRLRGSGICNGIGRIVGIIMPLVVVRLYAHYQIVGVITLMAGLWTLQAIVVAAWGIETSKRSLEELAFALELAHPVAVEIQPGLRT
jgi:MFS transporter, putative metabolite:H+ symporter